MGAMACVALKRGPGLDHEIFLSVRVRLRSALTHPRNQEIACRGLRCCRQRGRVPGAWGLGTNVRDTGKELRPGECKVLRLRFPTNTGCVGRRLGLHFVVTGI